MEAFQLEQQLAEAARLDAQQAVMIREEKDKMHREQQKAKVFLCLAASIYTVFRKREPLYFGRKFSHFWSIFIIFVPLETEMNTL